jgi:hypothetical protein
VHVARRGSMDYLKVRCFKSNANAEQKCAALEKRGFRCAITTRKGISKGRS